MHPKLYPGCSSHSGFYNFVKQISFGNCGFVNFFEQILLFKNILFHLILTTTSSSIKISQQSPGAMVQANKHADGV